MEMPMMTRTLLMLTAVIFIACSCTDNTDNTIDQTTDSVIFNWFEYEGRDTVFDPPPSTGHYQNPILAGFYPDPSIVRVDDQFYMVNSSFGYFPGLPLTRSTDLVNWEPLGYVLERPEQGDFSGYGISRGIFAPTIRYHAGTFYVITTDVNPGAGNFIVTATDPAGDWSIPTYLPEIDGIDPSLFFDDNGRVYVTHNGPPQGEPRYDGHRSIWLWELDLKTLTIVPDSGRVIVESGSRPETNPIWIEGPHIYKVNGWYYLMCAEGGTSENHSEVVFRTRNLSEPFVPYENNPILTQRDLDPSRSNPIATTGHADLVQTPNGDWWAVFLGTRNYQQKYFNTGRETFLLPVSWENDWPVILPAGQRVAYQPEAPKGLPLTQNAEPLTGNLSVRDDFKGESLSWQWNLLRKGNSSWYSLLDNGGLSIQAKQEDLGTLEQPAFIARRQQNTSYVARASMRLPQRKGIQSGLAVFQNVEANYFLFSEKTEQGYRVALERRKGKSSEIVASQVLKIASNELVLEIEGQRASVSFRAWPQSSPDSVLTIATELDAKMLSTQEAGGFVGSYIGMHVRR